jgi:tryptophanyl-tRNA synthetase
MGLSYDPANRPEASNLLTIYAALAERSRAEVEQEFAGTSFADFKSRLADLAVEKLAPINAEMRRLMADLGHIDAVLRDGAERAAAIAEPILKEAYDVVGFRTP